MASVMNKYCIRLITGVLVCLFFSCEQYAIFDSIAKEIKPKPALIKGTPSKIVKDSEGNLYVANGDLWKLSDNQNNQWNKISAPADARDVATVGPDVYVISVGNSPSLSKLSGGTNGGTISVQGTVQGIFGANDVLYIAAGQDSSYSVYAHKGDSPALIAGVSGLLQGAAYYGGNYYLATSAGLYHSTDGSTFTSLNSGNFLGIIALADKVVAVTGSAVYEVAGGAAPVERASIDALSGALAASGNTLYLGRNRGYRTIDTSAAIWESKSPATSNYTSTIAQVRVTSMYAKDNSLVFSSVRSSESKRSGLMSLRNGSWNMEE
jgi:hypothetical protein